MTVNPFREIPHAEHGDVTITWVSRKILEKIHFIYYIITSNRYFYQQIVSFKNPFALSTNVLCKMCIMIISVLQAFTLI